MILMRLCVTVLISFDYKRKLRSKATYRPGQSGGDSESIPTRKNFAVEKSENSPANKSQAFFEKVQKTFS